MSQLPDTWPALLSSPLAGFVLTLLVYCGCHRVYRRFGAKPALNPVVSATLVLVAILGASGMSYEEFFEGARLVHFMLGPAVVALAVPLYELSHKVREAAVPILVSIVAGAVTAASSAVAIAWALGATPSTLLSIAPKSVTVPIAMGIAEQIGGAASLTAVFVVLTGMLGAATATTILDLVRIRDWRARGIAIGVAAHGQGTAIAMQKDAVGGAFSGLAMGLNGLVSAALLPLLIALLAQYRG
jgi:predicted murein hydrolase (TIGR00659 family)